MATFTINNAFSSVTGTAESDTFNVNNGAISAFGLEGDDIFNVAGGGFSPLLLDGGVGNDTFNFGSNGSINQARGGEGNDWAYIPFGDQNNVSGGAGNDWIGLGGGASSEANVLDGGDGD